MTAEERALSRCLETAQDNIELYERAANVLHPGFVATQFGHNNAGLIKFLLPLFQRLAARKPDQGARERGRRSAREAGSRA